MKRAEVENEKEKEKKKERKKGALDSGERVSTFDRHLCLRVRDLFVENFQNSEFLISCTRSRTFIRFYDSSWALRLLVFYTREPSKPRTNFPSAN